MKLNKKAEGGNWDEIKGIVLVLAIVVILFIWIGKSYASGNSSIGEFSAKTQIAYCTGVYLENPELSDLDMDGFPDTCDPCLGPPASAGAYSASENNLDVLKDHPELDSDQDGFPDACEMPDQIDAKNKFKHKCKYVRYTEIEEGKKTYFNQCCTAQSGVAESPIIRCELVKK